MEILEQNGVKIRGKLWFEKIVWNGLIWWIDLVFVGIWVLDLDLSTERFELAEYLNIWKTCNRCWVIILKIVKRKSVLPRMALRVLFSRINLNFLTVFKKRWVYFWYKIKPNITKEFDIWFSFVDFLNLNKKILL